MESPPPVKIAVSGAVRQEPGIREGLAIFAVGQAENGLHQVSCPRGHHHHETTTMNRLPSKLLLSSWLFGACSASPGRTIEPPDSADTTESAPPLPKKEPPSERSHASAHDSSQVHELSLSHSDLHQQAQELDLQGDLAGAISLYSQACKLGQGASCYSIADLAWRCVFVEGPRFFAESEAWMQASCDAGYVRGCVELQLLTPFPSPEDRPPWHPTAAQCAELEEALSDATAPGSSSLPSIDDEHDTGLFVP